MNWEAKVQAVSFFTYNLAVLQIQPQEQMPYLPFNLSVGVLACEAVTSLG